MPGLEGFPFGLQGFQQVEKPLLGFQGVGASVRMQEFEPVLQLENIISNGHHRFLAPRGANMAPPPLGGGVLHSFFFTAVRPIGLGSSFIFLRCPEEKRTKKKGAQGGKRTRPMASNSFSRGGRHRKRHLHNPQGTKDTCTQGREKDPVYAFRLLFPGQETLAEGLFYIVISSIHYIKGQQASLPSVVSICNPCPFLLSRRGGSLDSGKAV